MLSFLFRLFRLGLSLLLGILFTLAILALQLRYQGGGQFQIRAKERLGLEETVLWPARTTSESLSSGDPIPPSVLTGARASLPGRSGTSRFPGGHECAEVRAKLDRSLRHWSQLNRREMEALDIFALLDAEVLDELPACPCGGAFRLSDSSPSQVICTMHGV